MKTVKLNPQVLAKQLCQEFPEISHAKVLELIARSAGYTGFRAMKSCLPAVEGLQELVHRERAKAMRYAAEVIELFDDATMKGDHMLSSTECANVIEGLAQREVELADMERTKELQAHAKKSKKKDVRDDNWETIMFTLPMRAWECAGFTDDEAEKEVPAYKQVKYSAQAKVLGGFGERSAPALVIDIVPDGETIIDSKPTDRLSLSIEINDGVPCVHLTNDACAETLLSVFGSRDGLLVREGEGEFIHVKRHDLPESQKTFNRLKANQTEHSNAWFVENVLAENWEVEPIDPPSVASGPFYVWADETCDNRCETLEEAIKVAKEFLVEGTDAYVVDVDDNVVWSAETASS